MIKKELSPEQIEQLFSFVKSKYVRYVDCQYELVDHLASAIEEEMEIDNTLDFNQALSKVYNRFPITGFTNFMSAKEKAITTYWSRRMWKYMLNFLKPPQIFATILIVLLIYQICYSLEFGFLISLLTLYASSIISHYYRKKHYEKIFSDQSHQLLVVSIFRGLMGIEAGVGLSTAFALNYSSQYNVLGSTFIAFAVTYTIVWNYASSTAFPEMIKEELEQKYAHIDYQKVFAN